MFLKIGADALEELQLYNQAEIRVCKKKVTQNR